MMYRNITADLIRTMKLDEFRSAMNGLLANDGSGKAHTTDVSVREQLIDRYIVESMEFGFRKCYLNIEKTLISGFELYEYDSLPRYLSRERALEIPSVKCGDGEKYISEAWNAAIKSYKAFIELGMTKNDSIMATLRDKTVYQYLIATDDDDENDSSE